MIGQNLDSLVCWTHIICILLWSLVRISHQLKPQIRVRYHIYIETTTKPTIKTHLFWLTRIVIKQEYSSLEENIYLALNFYVKVKKKQAYIWR